METRRATGSKQWFLEHKDDAMTPVFHYNTVEYFVCGENAFRQIAADIKKATTNIDIVCWGFDPSMELTRDQATDWPRGETWASLLYGAATGQFNGGKGVKVRILCWFDVVLEPTFVHNMPGFCEDLSSIVSRWTTQPWWLSLAQESRDFIKRFVDVKPQDLLKLLVPGSNYARSEKEKAAHRQAANTLFYAMLRRKQIPNLELHVRNGNSSAIQQALFSGAFRTTLLEDLGLKFAGTYHQKTILIDYEDTQKLPVGYVMGLNSVTNYWDTEEHLFNEPKRAKQFENSPPSNAVPPLRDYASRLQGECLVMVSKNFTDAWNKKVSVPLQRQNDPQKPPAHLTRGLPYPRSSTQITRTEPLAKERTIERLYYQIFSSARQYLYLENQYFQYAPLLVHLKKMRKTYISEHLAGKTPKNKVPMLHVIVITCLPERAQMVPRTHDAIKELGYGNSMPNQVKAVEAEIQQYNASLAQYKKDLARYEGGMRTLQEKDSARYKGGMQNLQEIAPWNYHNATPIAPTLSDVAKTYLDSGGATADATIQARLSDPSGQYAIRPVLACLSSFNTDYAKEETSPRRDYVEALKTYYIRRETYSAEYNRWLALGRNGPAPEHPKEPKEPKEPTTAQLEERKKQRHKEIYIHSKLTIADDSIATLGSANMNHRSFYADGEINVSCDDPKLVAALRHKVWEQISGIGPTQFWGGEARGAKNPSPTDTVGGEVLEDTMDKWLQLIDKNGKLKNAGQEIVGKLVPFYDERTSLFRLG
jgi:phosphatidylserine/phosphatidylglycerophosphate/cardiolipin synthase-like enzyme